MTIPLEQFKTERTLDKDLSIEQLTNVKYINIYHFLILRLIDLAILRVKGVYYF